jgi:hypothetical protein
MIPRAEISRYSASTSSTTKVRGATHLTIARVLRQEEREPIARQLRKHREPWLELVFPIDVEAETVDVEPSGSVPTGHPKLWKYALIHVELLAPSARFISRLRAVILQPR